MKAQPPLLENGGEWGRLGIKPIPLLSKEKDPVPLAAQTGWLVICLAQHHLQNNKVESRYFRTLEMMGLPGTTLLE